MRRVHGDETVDDWYWLLDRDDPDTVAYLEAENAYTEAQHGAPRARSRERLFEEIKARIQETDLSVPVRTGRGGTYPHRGGQAVPAAVPPAPVRTTRTSEELLLDGNELAGRLAVLRVRRGRREPRPRLARVLHRLRRRRGVHVAVQGPRHRRPCSPTSSEARTTGSRGRPTTRRSSTRRSTTAHRPYRVWRHRLGTDSSRRRARVRRARRALLRVGRRLSRSERFVVMSSDEQDHERGPRARRGRARRHEPTVVEPRRQGIEYSIDHQGDRFVDPAQRRRAGLRARRGPRSPRRQTPALDSTVRRPRAGTRLDGRRRVRRPPRRAPAARRADRICASLSDDGDERWRRSSSPSRCTTVEPGDNPEYDDRRVPAQLQVARHAAVRLRLRHRDAARSTLLKQQPVLGGYDPDRLRSRRASGRPRPTARGCRSRSSTARDVAPRRHRARAALRLRLVRGVDRPVVLRRSGCALLDRGFVFAHRAHPRRRRAAAGAGTTTASCCTSATRSPTSSPAPSTSCAEGYTSPERARRRAAAAPAGCSMGAVREHARPTCSRAVVAEVPFVDVRHHDARPDAAADRHRVGGVGQPDRRPATSTTT